MKRRPYRALGAVLMAAAGTTAALFAVIAFFTPGPPAVVGQLHSAVPPNIRVPFISNQGQADPDVEFYSRTFGGTVFVTNKGEVVYSLPAGVAGDEVARVVLTENFAGGKTNNIRGGKPAPTKVSYFWGNDRSSWKTAIPTYKSVSLGEVYDGIEVVLQAYGNNVEKIFIVGPGSDAGKIQIELRGSDALAVNDAGELEAATRYGAARFTRPVAFQEKDGIKETVDVAYDVGGGRYGFAVGDYDRGEPLMIDPLLASTVIGGSRDDIGTSIAFDAAGNVFIAGHTAYGTTGNRFPTTGGAYDETFNSGGQDIFISKFDSGLTTLLASTFIGGYGSDVEPFITVDGNGDVYVTGSTYSTNFPMTPGAYDQSYEANRDAFVSKLDNNLSTLYASTFLGRSNNDWGYSVAVAANGTVYVSGTTASSNFPTTPGAYDQTYNGGVSSYGGDIYVSKFNNDLSSLLASTFLGGSGAEGSDACGVLTLDDRGNVYVTGNTFSANFPTTPGAYDQTYNGGDMDIFVSRLDTALTTLEASTFLGGNDVEMCRTIALDGDYYVYVTGHNGSTNFPTTPGAYSQSYDGGYGITVSKLNGDLDTLVASTYLGGSSNDAPIALCLDQDGDVFVGGFSGSANFPTIPGSYSETISASYDATISKFDAGLTTLLASTFLGGDTDEWILSLRADEEGNVYAGGWTSSSDFPTTTGAYDESFNGGVATWVGGDAFISKLDGGLSADSTLVPVYLSGFEASTTPGAVSFRWGVQVDARVSDFRLTAARGGDAWEVPVVAESSRRFAATDGSPHLESSGSVVYRLFSREDTGGWSLLREQTVAISTPGAGIARLQAYPNPFNPHTTVSFAVRQTQRVTVRVFDAAGRLVIPLTDKVYSSGEHAVDWDGRDAAGRRVSSGVYFVRVDGLETSGTLKITMIR